MARLNAAKCKDASKFVPNGILFDGASPLELLSLGAPAIIVQELGLALQNHPRVRRQLVFVVVAVRSAHVVTVRVRLIHAVVILLLEFKAVIVHT